MITKIETGRDGTTPLRVYHRAGTIDNRKDEKFVWTHPYDERGECSACVSGTIPPEVRSAPA